MRNGEEVVPVCLIVVSQPGGDREHRRSQHAVVEHLQDCDESSDASVSICVGVDGFELVVGEGDPSNQGDRVPGLLR